MVTPPIAWHRAKAHFATGSAEESTTRARATGQRPPLMARTAASAAPGGLSSTASASANVADRLFANRSQAASYVKRPRGSCLLLANPPTCQAGLPRSRLRLLRHRLCLGWRLAGLRLIAYESDPPVRHRHPGTNSGGCIAW